MPDINTIKIRRAQQGDAETIAEVYEHYRTGIFRYLYYRTGDQQTAEDLTSEVFIRMLRFIGGFRPPSKSFQAWLYQIARNLATDHFRKTGTQQDIELEEHMFVDQQGSEAAVEKILTSDRLRQALNQLPDEQREVVTLRFVANMPIAEVASTLHKSEDAVKGLQRRSLIALRQILDAWEISYE